MERKTKYFPCEEFGNLSAGEDQEGTICIGQGDNGSATDVVAMKRKNLLAIVRHLGVTAAELEGDDA